MDNLWIIYGPTVIFHGHGGLVRLETHRTIGPLGDGPLSCWNLENFCVSGEIAMDVAYDTKNYGWWFGHVD